MCPEGPAAAMVRTDGVAAGAVSVCVGYGLQAGQAVGCGGHPCHGAEGTGHLAVLCCAASSLQLRPGCVHRQGLGVGVRAAGGQGCTAGARGV